MQREVVVDTSALAAVRGTAGWGSVVVATVTAVGIIVFLGVAVGLNAFAAVSVGSAFGAAGLWVGIPVAAVWVVVDVLGRGRRERRREALESAIDAVDGACRAAGWPALDRWGIRRVLVAEAEAEAEARSPYAREDEASVALVEPRAGVLVRAERIDGPPERTRLVLVRGAEG